jgi:hypothetical protein
MEGLRMSGKIRGMCALAALAALAAPGGARADVTFDHEGNAATFKGKVFDLKEDEKGTLKISFKAGKQVTVTVKSDKKSDVNLFVYDADKKELAKDDSPGPDCKVTFTPAKDAEYSLVIVNKGPGANHSTMTVDVAGSAKEKAKEKATEKAKDTK